MGLKLKVVGKSDVGLVRKQNEDYIHIDEANCVFAVCDGMGGHKAGEIASMTASQTIGVAFSTFRTALLGDDHLSIDRSIPESGDVLLKSIRLANREIFNQGANDTTRSGMGTTVIALAFESDLATIAHVGDSRAYRLDSDHLQPLTRDHSWVEEIQQVQKISAEQAGTMVGKNVITRALGVRETVEVDGRVIKVHPGDIFILCSDGLCGFADDDEIFAVANGCREDIERIVDRLVQMANDRGGSDNVSVIAVQVEGVDESSDEEVEVFTLAAENKELLAMEDGWLNRFAEAIASEVPVIKSSGGKLGSRIPLILIFIAFVIIAIVMIIMTQSH